MNAISKTSKKSSFGVVLGYLDRPSYRGRVVQVTRPVPAAPSKLSKKGGRT